MGFLFTSLAFFLIWLGFLVFSKETRREQVIMSIVGAVLTPGILIIVSSDYRNVITDTPAVAGLADLIFVFTFFGIAAVAYQALFHKHLHKVRGERVVLDHPAAHLFTHLVLIFGLWAFISLLLIYVFALSTIQALVVGGLLIGTYIIADRHDLLMDALVSGLLMTALVFITEQLLFVRLFPVEASSFWQWSELSLQIVGGVPLEELLWAGTVGFAIGPLYEWLRRYELK